MKLKLWQFIILSLFLGLVIGIVYPSIGIQLNILGTIFINAIKMLVVPLIFTSVTAGIISLRGDTKSMGRIAGKTISLYIMTTIIAISFGLLFAMFSSIGQGFSIAGMDLAAPVANKTEFSQVILNLIPTNPFESVAKGNVLQVIVFAIVLGISINAVGEKGQPMANLFEAAAQVLYKMANYVMYLAPIGVFGLIAWISSKYGWEIIKPLIKVILVTYAASIIYMITIYGLGVKLFANISPLKFFKAMIPAQALAFTTASSASTLPISMNIVQKDFKISPQVSGFVLPLGATINMDGTAIYQGVSAVFIASAFGINLSFVDYATIIATTTLASIGTAGVPGAGLVMLTLVLSSVGIPAEGIAIMASIDRILDMMRTTVNITGDAFVAVSVGKSEEKHRDAQFFQNKLD